MRIHDARVPASLAVPIVLIVLDSGCSRVPQHTEHDEESNANARSAPLVVVGIADTDVPIGRPIPSRRNPSYPMQLHRVKVRIENVLKGSIGEQTISVYYFGFAGGFDGPRPLGFGREPSRRILWLRRDGGAFRTACDGWDYCTMFVNSGAHNRYRADPHQPVGRAVADILLTRGEGEINDLQFASAIKMGVPDHGIQDYVVDKLSQLAATESSVVKSSACDLLWTYAQGQIDSHSRKAQNSLAASNCNCMPKPDGNVLCQ